jgi:sRNA-binding carbon storage regulator CsrA/transcriptional regulator with XRE-family HTH domain
MLILSRKCADQLRIPEEDITLNVVEISGQRVCLGMVPPAGQPFDLREEDATDRVVPEVEFTERGYQVLVWAGPGSGLRINERVQVRVVAVDPDSVRLGIIVPPGKGRGDAPAAATPPRAEAGDTAARHATISQEVLAYWVAQKITAYLKDRPRGAVQELARAVGVSPVTINRWRKRETNVASDNLNELLRVLNVSRDDLAAELGVKEVDLPDIRSRGPAAR